MSHLNFRYGTMNSSKSANLLMTAYTLRSQGKKVILMKPSTDDRDGAGMIQSRVGLNAKADIVLKPDNFPLDCAGPEEKSCSSLLESADIILVDESQFLSLENVEKLRYIASHDKIPVICYGLLTDYRSQLFPGSKRLVEISDQIKEITYDVSPFLGDCCGCKTNKAIINSKFTINEDGSHNIVKEGSVEPDLGAEEKYKPMCWLCWSES